MIDEFAKSHLQEHLRWVREALVWKLDGLSEYDARRPLAPTGTNLLGLVKHNAVWDFRYFGEVFGRQVTEPLPRWDDESARGTDHWATDQETRDEVIGLYHRAWHHTDETIQTLAIDSPGFVPWWGEKVMLINVMVHRLTDATRHAGQADIMREQLDGAVGVDASDTQVHARDTAFWQKRRSTIEQIARAVEPGTG